MKSIHQPLDVDRREIRLIRVSKERREGVISIELGVWSLTDLPWYVALSYCWGSDVAAHHILLDGVPFLVRANLLHFLEAWSKGSQPWHWIFIDALCINQTDLDERSTQVGLMGDIYAIARQTIAWLGVNPSNDHASARHQAVFDKLGASDFGDAVDRDLFRTTELRDKLDDLGPEAVGRVALPFLAPAYWSRLWIVQELALGRNVLICYGRLRVASYVLLACLEYCVGLSDGELGGIASNMGFNLGFARSHLGTDGRDIQAMVLLSHRRRAVADSGARQLGLAKLVTAFCGQQCFNRLDKIFGLLGMTHCAILPDYEMPIQELYVRALVECVLELAFTHEKSGEDNSVLTASVAVCDALLQALALPPLHPTIMLATRTAFESLSLPVPHCRGAWIAQHQWLIEIAHSGPTAKKLVNAVAKVADVYGQTRLSMCNQQKAIIRLPRWRNKQKQYNSIVDLVNTVYLDVLKRNYSDDESQHSHLIHRLQESLAPEPASKLHKELGFFSPEDSLRVSLLAFKQAPRSPLSSRRLLMSRAKQSGLRYMRDWRQAVGERHRDLRDRMSSFVWVHGTRPERDATYSLLADADQTMSQFGEMKQLDVSATLRWLQPGNL